MDELHAKRAVIDPTNTNIPTILLRLLKKWSGSVNLTVTQPSYPHIYSIHTTAPVQQKKKPAISAFDYCLSLKLPDACTFISKRLLSSSNVNTDYIKKQLVPLVPDLRALLAKYDIPPTSPVFAALFRAIALLYVEKVLGKRPSSDALTRHVQAMARWTCACAVCPAVRRFLTTAAEEAKQWSRIGAPTRKHVEAYLAIHARPAATWETIRSTPQGLQVRCRFLLLPSRLPPALAAACHCQVACRRALCCGVVPPRPMSIVAPPSSLGGSLPCLSRAITAHNHPRALPPAYPKPDPSQHFMLNPD